MSATHLILQAIEKRRVIAFVYKGARRTAEPYILGHDAKGQFMLSAVQRSGGSGTGFRTCEMEGLTALQITDRHFTGDHPDYNPRDAYFARVLGKV